MTYDIGDVAVLTATFTDPETGDATDPDDVVCTIRTPEGETSTASVTKTHDGVYVAQLPLTAAGDWWYAFDGTGDATAAGEHKLTVRRRQVERA